MDHQTNGRLAWYLGWWEFLGKGYAYDTVYPKRHFQDNGGGNPSNSERHRFPTVRHRARSFQGAGVGGPLIGRGRMTFFLPGVLLVCCFISACGRDPIPEPALSSVDPLPVTGDTYVEASLGDPSRFNPLLASDSASGSVNGYLFNGLVKYDRDLKLVGDLAEVVGRASERDWKSFFIYGRMSFGTTGFLSPPTMWCSPTNG
jgi:hypothetical protein